MARRKHKEQENSERWLVSYADLLTLLFAFFVVMFASSQTDKSRAREISRAVDKALQTSSLSPGLAEMLGSAQNKKPAESRPSVAKPSAAGKPAVDAPLPLDLTSAIQALKTTLGPEMDQKQVNIHLEQRGAVISLNAQSVFPLGGDSVDASVYPLLAKVAFTLSRLPNPIRLEGHTDSLPISTARFRSNWELSAARSIAMLRILNERYAISRERMAIIGYADTTALGDNSSEAGRMKNRRVDVVVLTDYGRRMEPSKNPAHLTAPGQ